MDHLKNFDEYYPINVSATPMMELVSRAAYAERASLSIDTDETAKLQGEKIPLEICSYFRDFDQMMRNNDMLR